MLKESEIVNYIQLIRKIQNNKISKKASPNKKLCPPSIIPKINAAQSQKNMESENTEKLPSTQKIMVDYVKLESPQRGISSPRKKCQKINQSLNWLKRKNTFNKADWIQNSNFRLPTHNNRLSQEEVSPQNQYRRTNAYDLYCMELSKKRREKIEKSNHTQQESSSKIHRHSQFPRKKKPTRLNFSTDITSQQTARQKASQRRLFSKNKTSQKDDLKMSKIYRRKIKTEESHINNAHIIRKNASNLYDYLKLIADQNENKDNQNHKVHELVCEQIELNTRQEGSKIQKQKIRKNGKAAESQNCNYNQNYRRISPINKREQNGLYLKEIDCRFKHRKSQNFEISVNKEQFHKKYSQDFQKIPIRTMKNYNTMADYEEGNIDAWQKQKYFEEDQEAEECWLD